jgi:sulfide:quinone oxidoreductase
MGVPLPPSPDASRELLRSFAERDIAWVPDRQVEALDAARNVALLSDGSELPFDLFLGVPKHRAPTVVVDAGLTEDGWVAVDPLTLQTTVDNVYAIGDVTSVGTPKAGVFAEGQAAIVAHAIIERHHGRDPRETYDGHGVCYLEFGAGRVAEVDVTFPSDGSPHGTMNGPSSMLVKHKADFATTRVQRWFGRS